MKISEKGLETLLSTIVHRAIHFQRSEFKQKLVDNDKSYYMGDAQRKDVSKENEEEEYSRYKEVGMGLVNPAVEAEVSFLNALFLSDPKIFGVVSSNKYKNLAKVINAINIQHSLHTKWSKRLLKFFRDTAKYNWGALLCTWDYKQTYASNLSADFKNQSMEQTVWKGNRLSRIDPYNSIFDQSVDASDLAEDGEFFGIVEVMTQTKLYRKIQSMRAASPVEKEDVYNIKKEMWQSALSGVPEVLKYVEPPLDDIIPSFNRTGELNKEETWLTFSGKEDPDLGSKDLPKSNSLYNVCTFFLRVIPELYNIPMPDKDKVQIWEVVVVNGQHVIGVSRKTNAHDLIPVGVSQPVEDSLGMNTQGMSTILAPLQKLGKQLIDRRLASLDRNINDKAIYDGAHIDGEHLKSNFSDAKIPRKQSGLEVTSLDQIYMQIPFTDTSSGLLNQEFNMLKEQADELSGINKASRGQFVKGNKTLEEYSDVMSNADSKQYARAGAIESQAFSVIKHIIKWNLLQFADDEELMDPTTGESVKLDRNQMQAAVFDFKLADGLNPASKFLNTQEVLGLFQLLQIVAQQNPETAPNLMDLLTHVLQQGKNIDLSQYLPQQPQQGGGT